MRLHIFKPRSAGAPTFTPTNLAQHYTSTDGKSYISVGVSSAADWVEITYAASQFALLQSQIDTINLTLTDLQTQIDAAVVSIAANTAAINAIPISIPNATFTGDIDSVNNVFTITETTFDPASVMIFSDGLFLQIGTSYTLTGTNSEIITITDPDRIPVETFAILLNNQ